MNKLTGKEDIKSFAINNLSRAFKNTNNGIQYINYLLNKCQIAHQMKGKQY